jgi:hypothetical protein
MYVDGVRRQMAGFPSSLREMRKIDGLPKRLTPPQTVSVEHKLPQKCERGTAIMPSAQYPDITAGFEVYLYGSLCSSSSNEWYGVSSGFTAVAKN